LKETAEDLKNLMMIFVFCIPFQLFLGYKMKNEMGLACGTHMEEKSPIQIFERESKGKR
jgi:hypothetical protein